MKHMNDRQTINVWTVIVGWGVLIAALVVLILVAIRSYGVRKNLESNEDHNSYIITYNKELYCVVPNDMIEEDIKYKNLLDKYNIPKKIKKDNIGKCVAKLKNSFIFEVKGGDGKEILILKDNNGDLMYIFSEKLMN